MAKRNAKDELTDQQELFCREYMKDLNATQAAIRAGYSEATACEQASRLLANVKVQDFVATLKQAQFKRVEIDADTILRELLHLATVDVTEIFDEQGQMKPLSEIPEAARKAIAGIEVHEIFEGQGQDKMAIGLARRVKFWDKTKSLELLGKHLKLFADRVEHSGTLTLEQLVAGSNEDKK